MACRSDALPRRRTHERPSPMLMTYSVCRFWWARAAAAERVVAAAAPLRCVDVLLTAGEDASGGGCLARCLITQMLSRRESMKASSEASVHPAIVFVIS